MLALPDSIWQRVFGLFKMENPMAINALSYLGVIR